VKGADATAEVWAWYPNLPAPGAYQITDNSVPDTAPAISGQRVVWVRGTGGAGEIWRHDPLATTPTRQVTNDGLEDAAPAIDGERLVWQGFDNDDFEIWTAHTDGGPQQLSTNEWDDLAPQLAGNHVVWTADEPGDAEIWISWDGGPPEPLTDNAVDDGNPRVAGDYVVWEQCTDLGGPSESCDIWMAPEPAGAAIGAAAWGALAALGARRRGRERGWIGGRGQSG
jgi:hypothetical protein